MGFPGGSMVENPPANAGDMGLILGSERCLREGNGNPLQYSCLGNPTDREAWWVIVRGVARVGHNLAIKQQQCQDDTEFLSLLVRGPDHILCKSVVILALKALIATEKNPPKGNLKSQV